MIIHFSQISTSYQIFLLCLGNLGKMREFVLITEKGGYYTSLGDFDPTEDKDLCYTNRELKVSIILIYFIPINF